MTNDLYSNYVRRESHPRSQRFITSWHKRLFMHAGVQAFSGRGRLLEIGPGHGYIATLCRGHDVEYEFVDTSSSVASKLSGMGFSGHVGMVGDVTTNHESYDFIWLSHVLEHSPTWLDARELLACLSNKLGTSGRLVVIGPDSQSWRREFWNCDATHGYPTTLRNVIQLLDDVGLDCVVARHHRNGKFDLVTRALFFVICFAPHRILDRIISRKRAKFADGPVYSWKAVFGWRQIFLVARSRVVAGD